jgi:ankyrin repeat protein
VDEVRESDGMTALALAARTGSSECLKVLLDHKASVDLRDHSQLTALHHAAYGGSELFTAP